MTPKKLTDTHGYTVIIRFSAGNDYDLYVYLYNKGQRQALRRPVDNGRWMDYDDLSRWEKVELTADQIDDFTATAEWCYCYKGVDRCDFCCGRRSIVDEWRCERDRKLLQIVP